MSDLPELDAVEQRILGALLEKQRTVPATYPLTLNALRTACNQTSSREPVMDLDERTVETVARSLKDRHLLRIVWADTGRRTLKYHQVLDEALSLQPEERALLTVLLLRGPQAPGELRTRTERLHHFADRGEVERTLSAMAAATTPLVRELPRQAGQHDNRWVHLLGPVALPVEEAPAGSDERGAVLAEGAEARDAKVARTYATVASPYADQMSDALRRMPFERWLLKRVARLAEGHPVVDAGCGPGHVADYLARRGMSVTGIDQSPEMIAEADRRFPDGDHRLGDLRRLMRPDTDDGWGAVLAWYSLVHLAPTELPAVVASLARPLRPDGWLLLGLHTGDVVHHEEELFGHEVDVDFVMHRPAEVLAAIEGAGLTDVEWYHRGPYPWSEKGTERLYVLARRPGVSSSAGSR